MLTDFFSPALANTFAKPNSFLFVRSDSGAP